jgi:hypothetical protein
MPYQAGFYVSSVFCSPRCKLTGRLQASEEVECFAALCREFFDSLLGVIVQGQGKIPPTHWFSFEGEELPRDPLPLLEAIIVQRIKAVLVQGLSYRNGYAGRQINLEALWESWVKSSIEPGECKRIALAEAAKAVAAKFPTVVRPARDSMRPPPQG